jgi:hypothetical protein
MNETAQEHPSTGFGSGNSGVYNFRQDTEWFHYTLPPCTSILSQKKQPEKGRINTYDIRSIGMQYIETTQIDIVLGRQFNPV